MFLFVSWHRHRIRSLQTKQDFFILIILLTWHKQRVLLFIAIYSMMFQFSFILQPELHQRGARGDSRCAHFSSVKLRTILTFSRMFVISRGALWCFRNSLCPSMAFLS